MTFFISIVFSSFFPKILIFEAGVETRIDQGDLKLEGVKTNVLLQARLGAVYQIISEAFDSIDKNPSLFKVTSSAFSNSYFH